MPCISPAKVTQPKGVCRRCVAQHGDAAHTYDEVKGRHCPMCEAKVRTLYTRSAAVEANAEVAAPLRPNVASEISSSSATTTTQTAAPLNLSVETQRKGRWQTFHDMGIESCHFLEYEAASGLALNMKKVVVRPLFLTD